MIGHGAFSRMSNFILHLGPLFRLTENLYDQVDWQHYHHKPLSCLQVDPTELRQVANIQQIFIRHCTARRSSIQLSCNCRAVLIAKGEEHHKRRSGHIATDKSNTLYDKNRIVCFITILCKSLMRCTCLMNLIIWLTWRLPLYMTLHSKVALFTTFLTGFTRRSIIRTLGATKLA